ncbi:(d)CMP kinase [Enterococcus xiangfangensis]|uniref:Cytidylate kinase n=1 Tax=Enterococcus xiangfangensis TaxID=1296537 RepID=A0ABU3FBF5_9ENTE|nr:(d)CMP kinase [Enterococcus xiangfangensis]MDT2759412.1 (d)CMP kinase [Enterococcus xiangfangensis]
MENISIAIDGPASSGKSTVAKILASDFNFIYVDTGAMYRAVTFLAIKHNVAFSDEQALAELTKSYPITFKPAAYGQLVFADGEEITQAIRQPDVTAAVSEVSAHGKVREELVKAQRQLAQTGGIVMDGRDIGTTVLPQAEVKIFLVASVEERAQRRYKENQEKGINMDFEAIKEAIAKRDYLDSHREVSPLVQAADAVLVDTTGMSIEQVVTKIKAIIDSKGF